MERRVLQTFYIISILTCVLATSIDDLRKNYVEFILVCAKEFPLTPDDITLLQNKELPDKESIRCLFACAYKKSGMMDGQGNFSVEGTQNIIRKYLASDPRTLGNAIAFTEACKHVNDEAVSDGDKGCERAALMFECSVKKAPEFNLLA